MFAGGLLFSSEEEFKEKVQSVGAITNEIISLLSSKKKEIENALDRAVIKYQEKVTEYGETQAAVVLFEMYKKKTSEVVERLFYDYVVCVSQNSHIDPSELLNKWFLEHMNYPFPSSTEKKFISQISGLTEKQITNWFINNRGRSWKPIVEQSKDTIYNADFAQGTVLSEE